MCHLDDTQDQAAEQAEQGGCRARQPQEHSALAAATQSSVSGQPQGRLWDPVEPSESWLVLGQQGGDRRQSDCQHWHTANPQPLRNLIPRRAIHHLQPAAADRTHHYEHRRGEWESVHSQQWLEKRYLPRQLPGPQGYPQRRHRSSHCQQAQRHRAQPVEPQEIGLRLRSSLRQLQAEHSAAESFHKLPGLGM